MATDIIVSEMTSATQINTNDLMIMTQPDLQAETGYSTKKGTVLQVANKMLKGTEYLTDLPDFTDKTVLGGLEELKGDLTALLPVNSASGAIANFDTDLTMPLVDCKAYIVASQASGTPTPSTPLPITGYSSANITRCGVNLFDKTATDTTNGYKDNYYLDNSGNEIYSANYAISEYISFKPSVAYLINGVSGYGPSVAYYDKNKTLISASSYSGNNPYITTSVSGTMFIRFSILKANIDTTQLEIGSTATAYAPYNGSTVTIAFGQTVYGGVLDVTRGKLSVTHERVKISDPNLTWYYTSALSCFNTTSLASVVKGGNNGVLCECESLLNVALSTASITANDNFIRFNLKSDGTAETGNFGVGALVLKDTAYSDVPSMLSALGDYYVLYELATPFDIDLTPVQINALMGVNNVYNDTNGDTEVKYKEGIQHYIDKKIAATQALIL